jgi:hypothetical protein
MMGLFKYLMRKTMKNKINAEPAVKQKPANKKAGPPAANDEKGKPEEKKGEVTTTSMAGFSEKIPK